VIVEKIETESPDVLARALPNTGTLPEPAYRVVLQISKEGDQRNVIRFTVRRDGVAPQVVSMEVYCWGSQQ
jgi:hypothetical protein